MKIEPIEVAGRVIAVAGDITLPGLGLSHEDERFHFLTTMQKKIQMVWFGKCHILKLC